MDKQTQCQWILAHLENGGSLTHLEAENQYSVLRLAARISDLRRRGHNIKGDMVTVKNKYGQNCRVKRYYMGGNVNG